MDNLIIVNGTYAAIQLAEQGHSVLYISNEQWQSLPAFFHDRENSNADSLKRIKFMYLKDYEMLADKLINLHTFSRIPTVVLIDDLNQYSTASNPEESPESHLAKLCATIIYSLNNCANTLKLDKLKFCTSITNDDNRHILQMYFDSFWTIFDDDEKHICVAKYNDKKSAIFKYKQLQDKVVVLKEIVEKIV